MSSEAQVVRGVPATQPWLPRGPTVDALRRAVRNATHPGRAWFGPRPPKLHARAWGTRSDIVFQDSP